MQIPKKKPQGFTLFKKVMLVFVVLILLVITWLRLSVLNSGVQVFKDELIIAQVEKGDLIRDIRASGTLVPISSNFLAVSSNGRVKEIFFEASDVVEKGNVIMLLENIELTQALDEAKLEVAVVESEYNSQQQRGQQAILKQRIVVADFKARYEMTKLRREANQRLVKIGAVSNIDYHETILLEQQLKFQHELEVELLASLPVLKKAELVAAQAKVDKAMRQLLLKEKLASDLYVKAPTKGIVQDIVLQVGESFTVGTVLAQIAEQGNLKAELRVQESLIKDVVKGQSVRISAGGNFAHGIVKRINPGVSEGVVLVDVHFTDELLIGARPDLRIDGVIELEHIKGILKLKRPVFSQEFSSNSVFVLNEDLSEAERKQVKFGRSSVDMIEIVSLLNEGDRVIVSSTNKYDELTKIYLR